MTGIDTVSAAKHWKDETEYLKRIGFVSISEDGMNISLLGDEEGNSETLLTPKAARYVAKRLLVLCDAIDAVDEYDG